MNRRIIFQLLMLSMLSSQPPYKLMRAGIQDILQQNVIHLQQNVWLRRDTLDIYTDDAIIRKQQQAILSGNVRVINGAQITITSQRADLNGNTRTAWFYDSVRTVSGNTRTWSDSLRYQRRVNRSDLFGTVRIRRATDKSLTTGRRAVNFGDGRFHIYGDAVYSAPLDSFTIASDTLEFNRESKQAQARSRVRITRTALRTESRYADFLQNDSILVLTGDPVVYYLNNEIRADSIRARFANQRLDYLTAYRQAISINVVDSVRQQINRIMGREIRFQFEDGRISEIFARNQAVSIYYFYDDTLHNGTNSVSADSLRVVFKNGQVAETFIFGGVEGTFYPPDFRGQIKDDY